MLVASPICIHQLFLTNNSNFIEGSDYDISKIPLEPWVVICFSWSTGISRNPLSILPPFQNVDMLAGASAAIIELWGKGQKNCRKFSWAKGNKGKIFILTNNYLSWLFFVWENETFSFQPHYTQNPVVYS